MEAKDVKPGVKVRRIAHHIAVCDCPIGFETEIIRPLTYGRGFWYKSLSGHDQNSSALDDWELVQPTGPVVTETVTKTRIVPGVYGKVSVGEIDVDHENKFVKVQLIGSIWINADELDAAAAVLSALAKGLREA